LDRSGFQGDKKKRKYFYFYKRKGYKYEDELGQRKYNNRSLATALEMLVGISPRIHK
jgi:hypothetical protein